MKHHADDLQKQPHENIIIIIMNSYI